MFKKAFTMTIKGNPFRKWERIKANSSGSEAIIYNIRHQIDFQGYVSYSHLSVYPARRLKYRFLRFLQLLKIKTLCWMSFIKP